ncbi:MAG: 4Fe-4S dicluster domain-containing protein [Deltaproteobacteria bacterium]|nr:MAG: 4Fe-4S dicluster domain-containing protein [Deltaproteobacteria bacterium]
MQKKRVVFSYPQHLVEQPVITRLVKDFDLTVNILRARITPKEQGRLVLEMTGKRSNLEAGINYIKELGVEIQSLAQDVKWHEDRCTHCTACISICRTRALDVDRSTMEVSFNRDKCIACELCIPVCPYQAMEILF